MKKFSKIGISPDQHAKLIKVCEQIDDANFVHAAVKLSQIECHSNMNYEEIVNRLENAVSQLPLKEKSLNETKSELADVQEKLNAQQRELAKVEAKLLKLHKDIKAQEAVLARKTSANMKKLKVKQAELKEVAQLKAELSKRGLDIETLMKLVKEFAYGTAKG
jgi:septal ring factor EnvC (AmiA/AmiB activator)